MPIVLRAPWRSLTAPLALVLFLASWPASAHEVDCSVKKGLDLARCQRHVKMAGTCGPLKGDEHYACDREFLLANPLNCSALQGTESGQCQAETTAFKACESKPGRDFMRCVADAAKASPMGKP